MRIFVDMDGVLADFQAGASQLFGVDLSNVTTWDYFDLIGVTEDEFWARIKREGSRFWERLPAYDWHHELLAWCGRLDREYQILTKPGRDTCGPSSAKGKIAWLQKHYGESFHAYLVGANKHRCAGPDAVLIDDVERNCERFREAGGTAILFPQSWNANRDIADRMAYVANELEAFRKRLTPPQPVG